MLCDCTVIVRYNYEMVIANYYVLTYYNFYFRESSSITLKGRCRVKAEHTRCL